MPRAPKVGEAPWGLCPALRACPAQSAAARLWAAGCGVWGDFPTERRSPPDLEGSSVLTSVLTAPSSPSEPRGVVTVSPVLHRALAQYPATPGSLFLAPGFAHRALSLPLMTPLGFRWRRRQD